MNKYKEYTNIIAWTENKVWKIITILNESKLNVQYYYNSLPLSLWFLLFQTIPQ